MRIGVIIRCHNHGRYLAEALTSALRQTRPPDEVVVVDDCSTDDTAEVARYLARSHPVVRVITQRERTGPAESFNNGVRASTGELLLALDADDRLSEDYLERCEHALQGSDADFAYGGTRMFGAVEGETGPVPFDADELMVENFVHVSALFRRWIFEATGGFRRDLDHLGLEDWEFWVHAVEVGASGIAVPGCHLEYRRGDDGARSSFSRITALRAHLAVRTWHPTLVRPRHVVRWLTRSLRRQAPMQWLRDRRGRELRPPVDSA